LLEKIRLKPFVIGLILFFVVGFYLDGFSYGKTCPKCDGTGKVICTSGHGTGTCSWCGGSGKDLIFNPNATCPLCDGTGDCKMCNGTSFRDCDACVGSGWFLMYSAMSSIFMFFTAFLFCFLGLFCLEYLAHSIWLNHNPWVRDVEKMGFWFNPMFFTWVFYRDHKRWVKLITAICLVAAILIVINFAMILMTPFYTMSRMTSEIFLTGTVSAICLMILFSLAWYQDYDKIRKALSTFE